MRALREQAEEHAKAELGRELALEAEARAHVAAAVERLSQAKTHDGSANGTDFLARQTYVERCERELSATQLEVALAQNRVEERRRLLTQAARELETLERLKGKHLRAHEAENRRAEENTLSEVGLTMFRSKTA